MPSDRRIGRISSAPDLLTVEWADGVVSEFASLWLRDNVPEDRDPHSGQRLVDVTDLPVRPQIRAAEASDGAVRIAWVGEARPATFEVAWLASHAFGRSEARTERAVRTWLEGATLEAGRDFAWARLDELHQNAGARLSFLTRLLQDGIAFTAGVPATEGAILEAVSLFGQVLQTNYGLTFDVRSVPQPENLAYSDLGLGLHTDNPYREPVPGFQALHALIPSAEGGDSLFADGFALAERLRVTAPAAFARLTTTAIPFHYRSRDADLYAERPLIQLSVRGQIAAVHYNNRSVAPFHVPADDAAGLYAAYRQFAALLRDARFQLRTRLGSGMLVIFDNQRILHGRTAFTSARQPRHLRGCYLTRDSVYSEAAVLGRRLGCEGPDA
jgi:gamma-butyrobetaine dioxygenase